MKEKNIKCVLWFLVIFKEVIRLFFEASLARWIFELFTITQGTVSVKTSPLTPDCVKERKKDMISINNKFRFVLLVLIVFLLGFASLYFAIPIEELSLEKLIICFSVLLVLFLLVLIFVVIIVLNKVSDVFSSFKSFILLILFFVANFSLITFYTYKTNQSFNNARDTSLITETYYVENNYRNFLPYYDYFYNIGSEDAFCGFSVDKTDVCSYVRIDNRAYILQPNTVTYVAKCFKSSNLLLKLKCKFDNYLIIVKEGFVEEQKIQLDNIKIKIYQASDGYFATINTSVGVYSFQLQYVNKRDITLEKFIENVISQAEIITDDFDLLEKIEDKGRGNQVTQGTVSVKTSPLTPDCTMC